MVPTTPEAKGELEARQFQPIEQEVPFPPCVLLLNGFPGVGKCSIAHELTMMYPNTRVIDNHTRLNLVEVVEPAERSARYYELRTAIRKAAFESIKAVDDKDAAFIMTSCLSTEPRDTLEFREYLDIAQAKRIPFVLATVLCSVKDHHTRLQRTERKREHSTAPFDVGKLEQCRARYQLLNPCSEATNWHGVELQYVELDTTSLTDSQAAVQLARLCDSARCPYSSGLHLRRGRRAGCVDHHEMPWAPGLAGVEGFLVSRSAWQNEGMFIDRWPPCSSARSVVLVPTTAAANEKSMYTR
ncbi:hypothetical protein MMC19_006411 [Ptychographa xylographoides]|nr:hypothetical protein [Ptychographa xylographoides]